MRAARVSCTSRSAPSPRHPTLLSRDLSPSSSAPSGRPGSSRARGDHRLRLPDRLGEIGCPTLVVQGTRTARPDRGRARVRRRIPEATTLILDDTGHVPKFERPAAFNRALIEFLGQADAREDADPATEPLLAEAQADAGLA